MTYCPTQAAPFETTTARLALRVKGKEAAGELLLLGADKTTLGSGQSCTHRLHQPGVRPLHCLITNNRSGFTIRRWADGTLLNGELFTEAPLTVGDCLTVGPVELEVAQKEECENAEYPEGYNAGVWTDQAAPATVDREEVSHVRAHGRRRGRSLIGALRAARNENQAAREQEEQLRGEVTRLEEQRAVLEAELVDARQEIDSLHETCRQTEDQAEARLVEVERQIAERNELVQDLQAELERQQQEMQKLVEAVDQAQECATPPPTLEEAPGVAQEVEATPIDNSANVNWEEEVAPAETEETSEFAETASQEFASASEEAEEEVQVEEPSDFWATAPTPGPVSESVVEPAAEFSAPPEGDAWDIETKTPGSDDDFAVDAPSTEAAQIFGGSSVSDLAAPASEAEVESFAVKTQVEETPSVDLAAENLWDQPSEPEQETVAEDSSENNETPFTQETVADVSHETLPEFSSELPLAEVSESADEELWPAEPVEESTLVESADLATPTEEPASIETEAVAPATTVFDAPERSDEQPEAPVSFIEQYRHMLPEDDAECEPVPEPVVSTPVAEPALDENGAEDDSIEDYMAQMMARLRGDEAPQAAPAAAATPTPVAPVAQEPVQEVAAVPVAKPTPIKSLEELKTGPAPEQAKDMSALRDLANDSARQAIKIAGSKRARETAYTHLALSTMAIGFGGYAVWASNFELNAPLFGGLAVTTAGAYWAFRTVGAMMLPTEKKNRRASKSVAPQVAELALPISGTAE